MADALLSARARDGVPFPMGTWGALAPGAVAVVVAERTRPRSCSKAVLPLREARRVATGDNEADRVFGGGRAGAVEPGDDGAADCDKLDRDERRAPKRDGAMVVVCTTPKRSTGL